MLRYILVVVALKPMEEAFSPAGSTVMERGNRKKILRDVVSRQIVTARHT